MDTKTGYPVGKKNERSARGFFLFSVVVAASILSSHIAPVMAQTSMDKWAVIACGGLNDSLQDEFENQIAEAYNTLLQCGFNKSHIYYLDLNVSRDVDGDNITDVNAYTSVKNISDAITNWLYTRSDSNDLVFIYLEDHGEKGNWTCNPDEVIYYSNLSDWIDQVSYFRLILIVDACYSASMIGNLTKDNRILIASADYLGRPEGEYLLFSHTFFQRVLNMSIYHAFLEAAEHAYNVTKALEPADVPIQWAVMDDNGDGNYSVYSDPPKDLGDGYLADVTYLNGPYRLNIKTLCQETELLDVKVWFNGENCGGSPVTAVVNNGTYTVEVESIFYRQENKSKYTFLNWENETLTNNTRTVQVSGDVAIIAYYKGEHQLIVETKTLDEEVITGVKVWIDGDLEHSPVSVIVTATNHTVKVNSQFFREEGEHIYNYTFNHWKENNSTANPREIFVQEPEAITALYNKTLAITYNLTVKTYTLPPDEEVINDVEVRIDGGDPNYSFTPIVVTAGNHTVEVESEFTRNSVWRYTFHHWADNNSTNNTRTVNISSNKTLTAYYEKDFLEEDAQRYSCGMAPNTLKKQP